MLDSNNMSHFYMTNSASVLADRERSGNMNIFTASLTSLGSSMCNSSPRGVTATVWLILGYLRWISRNFLGKEISNMVRDFYFFRG